MTRFLMVLLRMAIGWHVCYEGLTKLDPHWYDLGSRRTVASKEWSPEMYLRNASSPFRDFFREIVDDFDGYGHFDVEKVSAGWQSAVNRASSFYSLSDGQRENVEKTRADLQKKLKDYLESDATKKKIEEYREARNLWLKSEPKPPEWVEKILPPKKQEVAAVPPVVEAKDSKKAGHPESGPLKTSDPLSRQILDKRKADAETKRRELIGPIDSWTKDLQQAVFLELTDAQRAMGPVQKKWAERTEQEKVTLTTKYGLALCGALMFVGLFSRLASLGAAGFLALFYFSYVPWPGYPPNPVTEGTYLIVNKNLIEMLACLMLATSPSGVWGGLDALVRGLITRPLFGAGAREVRERYGIRDEGSF